MMPRGQVKLLVVLILVAMLGLDATSSVLVQDDISVVNPPRRLVAHQKSLVSDVAVVVRSSVGHDFVPPPPPPIEQELVGSMKGVGNPTMQNTNVASRKHTLVGGSFSVDYVHHDKPPPIHN